MYIAKTPIMYSDDYNYCMNNGYYCKSISQYKN